MRRAVKYYSNSHALGRMALLFDHLERPIPPNHTIFSERELMFTFAILSPVRLPVVCLSVMLVHKCTLLRRLKFSAIFLWHLVRWPSADIQEKLYGYSPRGTPPSGELNTRKVAKYSDFGHIEV